MTLRLVKSLFAVVLVLGAGLALAVTPATAAAALVLDWQGHRDWDGCAERLHNHPVLHHDLQL